MRDASWQMERFRLMQPISSQDRHLQALCGKSRGHRHADQYKSLKCCLHRRNLSTDTASKMTVTINDKLHYFTNHFRAFKFRRRNNVAMW